MTNSSKPVGNAPAGKELPPIKFKELADALLSRADQLLAAWLSGGKRNGHEWVCGSLAGEEGTSLSINIHTGMWSDFATGEKGGDLVSLYAAIHGLTMGKAALNVARDEGLEDVAGVQHSDTHQRIERPAPPPAAAKPTRSDEGWTTMRPVPAHAPAPTFKHHARLAEDITHTAEYRVGTELHGFVVRFRTSDGGKDTLPYTWCVSARDGAARWHWKQFDAPRPLYMPGYDLPNGRTVVLVEGERKADVLQALLDSGAAGVYCVTSWSGGCKAWSKTDWSWLANAHVLLWPDADSKREPLTVAEKKACADDEARALLQATKPYLEKNKQPGMQAMLGIGSLLKSAHGCTVNLLPIPEVAAVADGWDAADAIETDGWDFDRVQQFFAAAYALPEDAPAVDPSEPPAKKIVSPVSTEGDKKATTHVPAVGPEDCEFKEHLQFMVEQAKLKGVWEIQPNRKLVITALRKASLLRDCLGFNDLTGAPSTMVAWPWRSDAGPLKDTDDLMLGDYLSGEYKLKAISRSALAEAIDTVAEGRRFHPVRDYLNDLQWDGTPRLEKWLIHVLGVPLKLPEIDSSSTMQELEAYEKAVKVHTRRLKYLGLVGKYMLGGLVNRVMNPGCKFDYSPVLEGLPGVGKSTFVKELVGEEYFSDTHFDVGSGKDGMEQLEGLWGYELSELTALKRADSEQIKQFFSSTVDRFRGAYGKYVQPHPRQVVIFCTTNKRQYLYDLTGNRRFWPIWIDQPIKIQWLRKYRDQLFAEAYAQFKAGETYFPTREEEEAYFIPEQKLRLVETAVQSRLYELLTRDGSLKDEPGSVRRLSNLTKFVTLAELVLALGADAAKSTSLLEGQIRGWLDSHGWTPKRETGGERRRGYEPPKVWPPKEDEDDAAVTAAKPDGAAEHAEAPQDEPEWNDDAAF